MHKQLDSSSYSDSNGYPICPVRGCIIIIISSSSSVISVISIISIISITR